MESLIVPGKLYSLRTIADYVLNAAKTAGLEKKASYNLRLAVDEIATNIIIHGYEEAGCEGNVNLQANLDEKSLTIILEDTGVRYDPTKKDPQDDLDLPLEERKIGGLGVYLAIQGVDQFSYARVGDRNRNIFVVYLPNK
jgi:serine/threonine-protein kinase RsbW